MVTQSVIEVHGSSTRYGEDMAYTMLCQQLRYIIRYSYFHNTLHTAAVRLITLLSHTQQ